MQLNIQLELSLYSLLGPNPHAYQFNIHTQKIGRLFHD